MKDSCMAQVARLGIVALGIAFATPGEAQAICGWSVTGDDPQRASRSQNISSGNFANASSNGSFNVASGDNTL